MQPSELLEHARELGSEVRKLRDAYAKAENRILELESPDGVSQLITFSGLKNRVGGHNREVPAFGYAGRVYGVVGPQTR